MSEENNNIGSRVLYAYAEGNDICQSPIKIENISSITTENLTLKAEETLHAIDSDTFHRTWTIDVSKNQELLKDFRTAIGWPEEPIRHKKLNRKSFKKALMAWGMPRNPAEKTCNYVANTPFWGCGYDYYAERSFGYIWR